MFRPWVRDLALITSTVGLAFPAMSLSSGRAYGQELAPTERTWLINSTKQSCERNQSGKLPKDVVPKYCECYAVAMSKEINRQELLSTRISPELQRKMDRASIACTPASPVE